MYLDEDFSKQPIFKDVPGYIKPQLHTIVNNWISIIIRKEQLENTTVEHFYSREKQFFYIKSNDVNIYKVRYKFGVMGLTAEFKPTGSFKPYNFTKNDFEQPQGFYHKRLKPKM